MRNSSLRKELPQGADHPLTDSLFGMGFRENGSDSVQHRTHARTSARVNSAPSATSGDSTSRQSTSARTGSSKTAERTRRCRLFMRCPRRAPRQAATMVFVGPVTGTLSRARGFTTLPFAPRVLHRTRSRRITSKPRHVGRWSLNALRLVLRRCPHQRRAVCRLYQEEGFRGP